MFTYLGMMFISNSHFRGPPCESLGILNEPPCASIYEILNHRLTNKIRLFFSPNLNSMLFHSLSTQQTEFMYIWMHSIEIYKTKCFKWGSAAVCLHFDSQGGLSPLCLHLNSQGGVPARAKDKPLTARANQVVTSTNVKKNIRKKGFKPCA